MRVNVRGDGSVTVGGTRVEGSAYRCACRNCREERLFDDYDAAQAFFGDHVVRGHEVELLNLAAKTGESRVRPIDDE